MAAAAANYLFSGTCLSGYLNAGTSMKTSVTNRLHLWSAALVLSLALAAVSQLLPPPADGNGPIQGRPKHAGVLVAGRNLAAADATCCRIMGLEPAKVRYLSLYGGGASSDETAIQQVGEPIGALRTRFDLLPELEWMRRQV